ncbi:MAG: hypothetical protein IJM15_08185 [Erysipelotrichaceae bacterium]|nr:hypothetical protein [Erysipelotrichaceae bacterium]
MKYIIAGHGKYPYGVLHTLTLLAGERDDVFCISAEVDNNDFCLKADELLERFKQEEVIVFCDIIEGAVNQYFTRKLREYDFHLVAGFNIAMILELLFKDSVTADEMLEIVEESREQMVYISDLLR